MLSPEAACALLEGGGPPPVALVVALDGGTAVERLTALARHAPCPVIGVGAPGARAPDLDLLLTAEADPPAPWVSGTPEPAVEAASRCPGAALALVQVLRAGASLTVAGALAVESMAYGMLQAGPEFHRWLASRESVARRPSPEPVRLERDGDVLTIVLDRPAVHNAYDAATRDALVDALELVRLDTSIAAAHLRGAGPSFCSGGDLSEFGLLDDPVTAHRVRMRRSAALAAARVGERLTAHLHGACVGAGIELASFAGRVTVREGAVLQLPEVAMGLIPGAGGTAGLPRRIGRQRTAWLALTGIALDAAGALRWGLADERSPG
jgi:hypothetical protein